MKIVIAGAGAVGFHLAGLLAKENQDIVLIDNNEEILEHAATHLDVQTLKGDATSIAILQQAETNNAALFLAVTESETTNLLSSILAKQTGAKKTIARVSNLEYLKKNQKEKFKELGVDKLICPHLLAAKEIGRLLQQSSFTDIFNFEEGKISVVGLTLDNTSSWVGKSLSQIGELNHNIAYRGIAILRNHKTIIPKGKTVLLRGDHLYLAVLQENLDQLNSVAGKQLKSIKRVMIIGGSELALQTARYLENDYSVSLITNEKKACAKFVEVLENTLVIKADYSSLDELNEEGLGQMDAFIALTKNSEINIVTGLLAEQAKVYKTIALVDNADYTHISQNIGIDTIINKKLIAANDIFRFVRKGKVEAIASLHGVEAELIEFAVHKSNRLTKHPIRDLPLPKDAIIAGVVRGEKSYIPTGDFIFELDDKVIVFALPNAIGKVEELFK